MSPASVFPTGVTLYAREAAYGCYVIFDGRANNSFLIDMNGNVVREWPLTGFPSEFIDPVLVGGARGRIFAQRGEHIFANDALVELDWDGNVVWEWGERAPGGVARQGHDQARLPSGNTLVLSHADLHRPMGVAREKDVIYEVSPAGDVVWSWDSLDHLDEFGISEEGLRYMVDPRGRPRSTPLVLNDMSPLGPNRWFDGGDQRFHPDNIMIDSREASFIAIISKRSGSIVWRLGPNYPAAYSHSARTVPNGKWPRPIDVIAGQHDAHMIPPGLPGEGNVLIFDNRGSSGFPDFYVDEWSRSRVIEVDPITKEIVWEYDASMSGGTYWTFHSSFISSARRLPNGNTLVCEGMWGRIFQVTRDGEIVWEYVNPHFGEYVDHSEPAGGSRTNWIYRAQPVPYEWVPEGTPREETPVEAPDISTFRVPDVAAAAARA